MELNIAGGQRSSAISLIRAISVCMIITCHMMQYAGMELAYWFNVGVQIFLCISGFLYGGKQIGDRLTFWKKRLRKILLDYYIVVIPVMALYAMVAREDISIGRAVDVLLARELLRGGGHLWFIATILLCYGITPLLAECFDRVQGKGEGRLFGCALAMQVVCFLLCRKFFGYFNPSMIGCYIFGFFLGRLEVRGGKRPRLFWGILMAATGMNALKILRNYIYPFVLPVVLDGYWDTFCSYAHMMLGVALFVSMYAVFSGMTMPDRLLRVLDVTDEYSYDVYLVHQFMILGPFSLMGLTAYTGVNICVILLLTAGAAYLVRSIARVLTNGFRDGIERIGPGQGLHWSLLNTQRSALMGIAMLWIVFFHMTLDTGGHPIISFVKGLGNIGVDMFLFLSGIGLYFSWKNCGGKVRRFYIKRLKRIAPATLLCLTPWFLYRAAMAPTTIGRFLLDITSLSFWLDGNNPGWFIAELVLLYCIYPLVARSMEKKPAAAFVLWIGAVVAVNYLIMKRFSGWYWAVELALTRIPVFLCGCFLAPWTENSKRLRTEIIAACAIMGVTILGLLCRYPHGIFERSYLTRCGYCLLAICLCVLLAICLARSGDSLERRIFRWTGQYTLEIYLIHTQVLRVLNAHVLPKIGSNIVVNLVALGLTLPLAVIVNRITGAFGRRWMRSGKERT